MPHPSPAGNVAAGAARERGSVTPFAIVLVFALLACLGLVVDGAAKLRAAREATTIAQAAARAGAGQVSARTAYTDGEFVVDRASALRAARGYLATTGHRGSVRITGTQTLHVTVTVTEPAAILPLIGITRLRATGNATAHLVPTVGGSAP